MDSRIPVKLANVHQVVTLTIPQDELLLLFLVPEFKNLVSRFRNKIKVQCAAEPCQLTVPVPCESEPEKEALSIGPFILKFPFTTASSGSPLSLEFKIA